MLLTKLVTLDTSHWLTFGLQVKNEGLLKLLKILDISWTDDTFHCSIGLLKE